MNHNLNSAISTALREPTLGAALVWMIGWLSYRADFPKAQREWLLSQIMTRWTAPVPYTGITDEQIADWRRIAELADAVRPWRDGDQPTHCTHCRACGTLYRTQDLHQHQQHCERLRDEMFDNRHALLARAARPNSTNDTKGNP